MDRRGFLIGATGLLVAGCARVPPPELQPSAAPQTPAAAPLAIGTDGTPAGDLWAELLAGVLTGKGRPATRVPIGADWRAALGHGALAAVPGFAATLWATLSKDDEPPAADSLLADLAGLVDPEVGVLPAPGLDGRLVWLVTAGTAKAGVASLSRVGPWSKGRRAAVPALAQARGDGLPGLTAVYGARFGVDVVEDPVERAARLTDGRAAVAAFRRSEYAGASGLVALVDPDGLATPDPGVLMVNSELAEAEPDAVLSLDAVSQAITTDALVDLQARVAGGGIPREVAGRWLREQGLA